MTMMQQKGDEQAYAMITNDVANNATIKWKGGSGTFSAHAGSWGGGSVKLQMLLPDGATYVDVGSDTSLSADGGGNFTLPHGRTLKVLQTTATGVYADITSHR